jgi:hypothetical protein
VNVKLLKNHIPHKNASMHPSWLFKWSLFNFISAKASSEVHLNHIFFYKLIIYIYYDKNHPYPELACGFTSYNIIVCDVIILWKNLKQIFCNMALRNDFLLQRSVSVTTKNAKAQNIMDLFELIYFWIYTK